jgi:uncharacterized protein (TIGR03086 family)
MSALLVADATAPLPEIVRAAATTPLTTPTPCAEWDLAALVRHVLFWSPFLAAAGRRTAPAPVAETEQAVALDGWPEALLAAQADVAQAWSDPAVWVGTTTMGGPDPMPAELIGDMVLGELVVHAWDLARTADFQPAWSAEVLAGTYKAVLGMAEQGREMGLFGPAVPTPVHAPPLTRILALTGRAPDRPGPA